jgi:hypothetical protein
MSENWYLRNQVSGLEQAQTTWIAAQDQLALNLTGPILALDTSHRSINTWAEIVATELANNQLKTPLVLAYRRLLNNPRENNSDLFTLLTTDLKDLLLLQ